MKPFYKKFDFEDCTYSEYDNKVVRKLSDIQPYVTNQEAVKKEKSLTDQVVYEVMQIDIPDKPGHIKNSVTVIKPGTIGEEYFFTKGHYHSNPESAEIYVGLKGRGILLLQKNNEEEIIEMEKGIISFIPPCWAHRTVNTGTDDFVFMSFYPGDAGYDYQEIQKEGFNTSICINKGSSDRDYKEERR